MTGIRAIGFIGTGVMGEPICANMAARSGLPVVATDPRPEPLARLAAAGVGTATTVAEVAARSDAIFLSLPGGAELELVVAGPDGLLAHGRAGHTVVDLGTSPVVLTRTLAACCAEAGLDYADAPVARTRAAARAGTLSIMVGASAATFRRLEPLLACAGSDVTHCGPVGAGQVTKLLNNMLLIQSVVALSEALAIGRRAGLDGRVLFEALAKGSADSFALRHHGMKALLPGDFPEDAFPTDYARKDLSYALELAREAGIEAPAARLAADILRRTSEAGLGRSYFPALLKVIEGEG